MKLCVLSSPRQSYDKSQHSTFVRLMYTTNIVLFKDILPAAYSSYSWPSRADSGTAPRSKLLEVLVEELRKLGRRDLIL